jgi:hypothetical protein
MVKRYWLFAGERFYPRGGVGDFRDSFDSEELATEAAKEVIRSDEDRWAEVVDMEQLTVLIFRTHYADGPQVVGPFRIGEREPDDAIARSI